MPKRVTASPFCRRLLDKGGVPRSIWQLPVAEILLFLADIADLLPYRLARLRRGLRLPQ
jgi:hypothetical protein